MTTSNALIIAETDRGLYFGAGALTDTSETEVQIKDIAGAARSLGEICNGHKLRSLKVQLEDGAELTTCKIYNKDGAADYSFPNGKERVSASEEVYNLYIEGLDYTLQKGAVLKITTAA